MDAAVVGESEKSISAVTTSASTVTCQALITDDPTTRSQHVPVNTIFCTTSEF